MSHDNKKTDQSTKIYDELNATIPKSERGVNKDQLLRNIREKAKDIDFENRREFESQLLKIADKAKRKDIRNILYEVMVSLGTIWNRSQPEKGLIEKFNLLFKQGKYDLAADVYRLLCKQGIDCIGQTKTQEKLLPIPSKENPKIIGYNDSCFNIYNLEVKSPESFPLPGYKIIDILSPSKYSLGSDNPVDRNLWLLVEDENSTRSILSFNLVDHKREKDKVIQLIDRDGLEFCFKNFNILARIEGHLLLVSKTMIIGLDDNNDWTRWFVRSHEITAVEEIKDYLWIGLSDGTGFAIKGWKSRTLVHLKEHSETIFCICGSNHSVAVLSSNKLNIYDLYGRGTIETIPLRIRVNGAVVLDEEIIAISHSNGMLVGRNIKNGKIVWKINFKGIVYSMFLINNRLYCHSEDGQCDVFKIPPKRNMIKNLAQHGVNVEENRIDWTFDTPIRYLSDFIGRQGVIDTIKSNPAKNYLIPGIPKIGKTSLLNILGEVLADSSIFCFIDMKQLLNKSDSYKKFEDEFIHRCLAQHVLKTSELKNGTAFSKLKTLIKHIKGGKPRVVFGIDNFEIPREYRSEDKERFEVLYRELFGYQGVQVILTCKEVDKTDVEGYFKKLKAKASKNVRDKVLEELPLELLSESDVKATIREKEGLGETDVLKIYSHIGRFPHFVHLFEQYQQQDEGVELFFRKITQKHYEKIFSCLQGLSTRASTLIGTLLHERKVGEQIPINEFYKNFPILEQLIPKQFLGTVLKELEQYFDIFDIEPKNFEDIQNIEDKGSFRVSLKESTPLFQEAAQYVPWIKELFAIYDFVKKPSIHTADTIVEVFKDLSKIDIFKGKEETSELEEQYGSEFYIRKLTSKGRKAIGLPLVTFLVTPLKKWKKEETMRAFLSLHISMRDHVKQERAGEGKTSQEHVRQEKVREDKIEESKDTASSMFYVLLFDYLASNVNDIKSDMTKFDRVSVIDSPQMNEILLNKTPMDRASQIIFGQLKISDRSPYTTTSIVKGMFYGRDVEIALIRGLPENIGIFGTRTIGKTSLLRKIESDVKGQKRWVSCALDCSSVFSEKVFLRKVAPVLGTTYNQISSLEKFKQYILRRAENENVQFLFLFDEVDGLVKWDSGQKDRLFSSFYELCTSPLKNGNIAARFIIFGFQHIYEQMKNPKSRLYNFMVFLPLKPLDRSSAFQLVTHPMENIRIQWENKKEDANYIIDQCSGHPMLIQAVCHALLKILDEKTDEKCEIIERKDVEQAFQSEQFRQLCMRYLYMAIGQFRNKGRTLLLKKKEPETNAERRFSSEFYQMTILLVAIEFMNKKHKPYFSLTNIQNLLKANGVDISPGDMREILNWLCLWGTFNLINEAKIIADKEKLSKIRTLKNMKDFSSGNDDFANAVEAFEEKEVSEPSVFDENLSMKFRYEFGVKVFPSLLLAHFDGPETCREEIRRLAKRINSIIEEDK